MTVPFIEPILRNFPVLQSEFGFRLTREVFEHQGFGSGAIRLETERFFIDFLIEGMGPEVSLMVGSRGKPGVDLAWIFAYLTQQVRRAKATGSPWLYYFPHFSLGIWGEASCLWQLARLADILETMWSSIITFLDIDGPRSADFLAFQDRAVRSTNDQMIDGYRFPVTQSAARAPLGFPILVEKSFSFLSVYNYRMVHSDPVFVRYETAYSTNHPATYVNIFHRIRSFQLGLQMGKVQADPAFELNFDIQELAAWNGMRYDPAIAHSPAELKPALNQLSRMFRRVASSALSGDTRLFDGLHTRRIDAARKASRAWSERNHAFQIGA